MNKDDAVEAAAMAIIASRGVTDENTIAGMLPVARRDARAALASRQTDPWEGNPAREGMPDDWGQTETDGLAAELEELFDKCKLWPEKTSEGQMALLELRNLTPRILTALSKTRVDALAECATIAERDNAELAVSMMYRAVTGKEPEWSSEFRLSHAVVEVEERITALSKTRVDALEEAAKEYPLGTRVTKTKGSRWTGKIVGYYATDLTPAGVAIESETETGSVQIYPTKAIRALKGADHA